ncbi:pyridoxamine 5'-phosphate oxidase family protein [Brevibacterium album]|uniref:pyridoxamine 5'-phosphate oxidase family protein n=1 Tax=Brevibacterium album TaxID=417948 RepID=UPI000491E2B3|nr:pyridoxamine 5'-phosphate oxidase family protein [Brevibacterium album]
MSGNDAIEVLSADACWTLLRTAAVGRLAVLAEGGPDIFPVNYVVDGGTVVFRTGAGGKLTAALGTAPVAFEADGSEGGRAWSVVLKGRAEQVRGTEGLLDTLGLRLHPWQAGEKGRFVRIAPSELSGRRFPVAGPEAWRTALSEGPRAAEE